MPELYPLKFTPIYKDYLWGGTRLKTVLHKDVDLPTVAESWELSGVKGNISLVASGALQGKSLQELIDAYGSELLGEHVFARFGAEFPVLVKFIDAQKDLSVQLHPGDDLARERHDSFGKTEMWYVMQADPTAELVLGFNKPMDKAAFVEAMKDGELMSLLNREHVDSGDAFLIHPGRVHAIGAGILLAEIQQTSDITYRIYDYDRKDRDGNTRELHTDLALDAINYDGKDDFRKKYSKLKNTVNPMVSSPYFITNFLCLNRAMECDVSARDSFHIYICTEGRAVFRVGEHAYDLQMGETLLIPAAIDRFTIRSQHAKILEVHL